MLLVVCPCFSFRFFAEMFCSFNKFVNNRDKEREEKKKRREIWGMRA